MKLATKSNITVNPPLKSISSMAGFAALTGACAFAEKILEKYSRLNEEYRTSGSFVFLKSFNEELRKEKRRRDEINVALRLMINRQLIVSGRLPAPGAGKLTEDAYYYRLSDIMLRLRNTDTEHWEQLTAIQKLISDEKIFSSLIQTNELKYDTHKELVSTVDMSRLSRSLSESANADSSGIAFETAGYNYTFSQIFVFRTEKTEALAAPPQPGSISVPGEAITLTAPESALNVRNENINYQDGDSLTLKTETSGAAEEVKPAEKPVISDTSTENNQTINTTSSAISLNVSNENINYQDGDSLILKTETSGTAEEVKPAEKPVISDTLTENNQTINTQNSDNTLNVSNENINYQDGDSLTLKTETAGAAEEVKPAEKPVISDTSTENIQTINTQNSDNTLNVSNENINYQDGDSLILKTETSGAAEEVKPAEKPVISDTSTENNQTINTQNSDNTLNVSNENINYQDGDSLTLKTETSGTAEEVKPAEKPVISDTSTENNQTINTTSSAISLNVSNENINYQDGDSLTLKTETSGTAEEVKPAEKPVISDTSTENNQTINTTSSAISLNVSNENINYQDGDSLILKTETSGTAEEVKPAEKPVISDTSTENNQTINTTSSAISLNVSNENINYQDGDSLILKAETTETPTEIHLAEKPEINTALSENNQITNTQSSANTLNVSNDNISYQSGDSLILKTETTETPTEVHPAEKFETNTAVTENNQTVNAQSSANTLNVINENISYQSGDSLILKTETTETPTEIHLAEKPEINTALSENNQITNTQSSANTLNVSNENISYHSGDSLILKTETTETPTDIHSSEKFETNTAVTENNQTINSQSSATTLNVSNENISYQSGDSLILKTETTETTTEVHPSEKPETNTAVTENNQTINSQSSANTLNVSNDNISYQSGDSLILKTETTETTEVQPAEKSEINTAVTENNQTINSQSSANTLNVSNENISYQSGDSLILKTETTETTTEVHPAEKTEINTALSENNQITNTQGSANTLNVSNENISYQSGDSLILKSETTETTTEVHPSEKPETNTAVSENNQTINNQSSANTLNVSNDNISYHSGDSLILKTETSETTEVHPSEKPEINTALSENNQITNTQSSANTLNVSNENISYHSGDSLILKSETTETTTEVHPSEKPEINTAVTENNQTINSQSSANTLNVSNENISYHSGDSLILKTETSETTEVHPAEKSEINTAVTENNQTINSQSSANTLNVSNENISYQSGDSLILKTETSETTEVQPAEKSEINTAVTENNQTINSQSSALPLNVSNENISYHSGDSLILKTETSETTEVQPAEKSEINTAVTENNQTINSQNSANTLNVSNENISYQSGDSLILKTETTETTTEVHPAEKPEINTAVTENNQTINSQSSANTLNVSNENISYHSGDSLILKTETTEKPTEVHSSEKFETNTAVTENNQTINSQSSANTLNVSNENISYHSGDSLILKTETAGTAEEVKPAEKPETNTAVTENNQTINSQSSANTLNVSNENISYQSGDSLILKAEPAVQEAQNIPSAETAAAEQSASVMIPSAETAEEERGGAVHLQMNSFLSAGSQYFSGLAARSRGRDRMVISLFRETLSGLQKNTEKSILHRTVSLLNDPGLADSRELRVIENAAQMIFRQKIDAEELPEIIRNVLTDTEKTGLLTYALRQLRENDRSELDTRTAAYEERFLRLIRANGTDILKSSSFISYPGAEEILKYYYHSPAEKIQNELRQFISLSPAGNSYINSVRNIAAAYHSGQFYRNIIQQHPEKTLLTDQLNVYQNERMIFSPRPAAGENYGYSGYPLNTPGKPVSILFVRKKPSDAPKANAIDRIISEKPADNFMFTERVFRNFEASGQNTESSTASAAQGMGMAPAPASAPGTAVSSAPELRTAELTADYSGTSASLSLLERPVPHQAEQSNVPMQAVPSADALIRQYGNLIEEAGTADMSVDYSVRGDRSGDLTKSLRELSARLDRAERQTADNTGMLKEMKRKQSEIENSSLRSSDVKKLSDDVINRIRSQLRLDRSRYS